MKDEGCRMKFSFRLLKDYRKVSSGFEIHPSSFSEGIAAALQVAAVPAVEFVADVFGWDEMEADGAAHLAGDGEGAGRKAAGGFLAGDRRRFLRHCCG